MKIGDKVKWANKSGDTVYGIIKHSINGPVVESSCGTVIPFELMPDGFFELARDYNTEPVTLKETFAFIRRSPEMNDTHNCITLYSDGTSGAFVNGKTYDFKCRGSLEKFIANSLSATPS